MNEDKYLLIPVNGLSKKLEEAYNKDKPNQHWTIGSQFGRDVERYLSELSKQISLSESDIERKAEEATIYHGSDADGYIYGYIQALKDIKNM